MTARRGLGLPHLGGDRLCELIGVVPETSVPEDHTGLSGAVSNVEVYRAMRKLQRGDKGAAATGVDFFGGGGGPRL